MALAVLRKQGGTMHRRTRMPFRGRKGLVSATSRRFLVAVTANAGLALCLVPASAGASSVNATSENTALRAVQRYFTTLVANIPASRQGEESYAASIRSACPNVLAAANAIPENSVNAGTVTAFGEELGLDLSIASFVPDRTPLATLTDTLSKLRWSGHGQAVKIKSALAAQRELFFLKPTDLCADARAVAASNFQTTPAATLESLAAFGRVTHAAGQSSLANVPGGFHPTRADKRLAKAIRGLAARWGSEWQAQFEAEAKVLESALGLTS